MLFFSGLTSLFLLGTVAGCGDSGPQTAPVKGVVKFNDAPYPNAIVTFIPSDGGPAGIGKTTENGEYEIWTSGKRGAVLGNHKVSVTTEYIPPPPPKPASEIRSDDPEYLAQIHGSGSSERNAGPPKEKIPAKYNTSTELQFEVKSGSNEFPLDLK